MKLKVLAILAASLTISTGASADLLVDFDSPAFTFTGNFATAYDQVFVADGLSMYPEKTIAVGSNPSAFHNQFVNIPNNSTGNMLLVNGSTVPNTSVLTYTNNSTLLGGSYVFKADVMNLCCEANPNGDTSTLLFEISQDGGATWTQIGDYTTTLAGQLKPVSGAGFAFTIADPSTFAFRIIDDVTVAGGNDFAIDNLSFEARSVPGPIVGAGLPGLVVALGGLVALARRRRNQGVTA